MEKLKTVKSMEPGAGLRAPCGSLSTQIILWFYDSMKQHPNLAKRASEAQWERQISFPLDTAELPFIAQFLKLYNGQDSSSFPQNHTETFTLK